MVRAEKWPVKFSRGIMSFTGNAVRAAILGLCLVLPQVGWSQTECDPDYVDIRGEGASVRFAVEVMDTPEGRARGLMHRESLGRFAGMLFVYPNEAPVAFWMRNTLIPLDMVFIDSSGIVRKIHANAIPLDETSIPSGEPVQYVLEINGGMADMLKLQVGDQIRHPALASDIAVWPCE